MKTQTRHRTMLLCLCLLASSLQTIAARSEIPPAEFTLNSDCPKYFALDHNRRCRLSTLYDLYPQAGEAWGGYRVALGPRRDGFTPQQIDLGRYLFFDPVLSQHQDLSCAHCHAPEFGMSDGRAQSMGNGGHGVGPDRRDGHTLTRSAPPLWNLAFQELFFWDGRATSLEDQIEAVFAHPKEMAIDSEALVARLNSLPAYRDMFATAYARDSVLYRDVLDALVAFETSLVSLNSAYDRYIHGAQDALTAQETNGLNVFRSFATRCSQCHTPPLFTSGQLATTAVPPPPGQSFDAGAGPVFQEPSLYGAFKVPSLRNIALTAPYMHAGQFQSLAESVGFYSALPGHAVGELGPRLTLHWHLVDARLRTDEIEDLVAFMKTLTDATALPEKPDVLPSGLQVLR
ncbi:di-heme cytochrome c peroxidase family protein [Luminiphilus syltensis NOR5-1B]|uniref:Di-heme cytochrome c peroxidase family protein n=1 Tax=Luminiphilus syltensis NOR5-1B TaxID=565045 RepID=B8KY00_9GAMM|nr:cytochrome c peroxidase [Luminiphilus syltensis]EED35602.1 di-heme cytochrome c peroxidase family protein [Luminiphilus syltensis NOR5-1B]